MHQTRSEREADVESEGGQSISDVLAHRVHAFAQTLLSKVIKILVSRFAWISKTGAVGPCCFKGDVRESLKQRQNKVIRMLGFNVESGKDIRWKVRQVQRDDQARI